MTLLIVALAVAVAFAVGGLAGAPYVPILKHEQAALIELADLKEGQTLVDLGSGDGRLLKAAAKRGVTAIGYEINPIMWAISWIVCFRYRKLVSIHLADFWSINIPRADVIYVFLIPRLMGKLGDKLEREIEGPTKVISFAFEIPGVKTAAKNKNTFVYMYGTRQG